MPSWSLELPDIPTQQNTKQAGFSPDMPFLSASPEVQGMTEQGWYIPTAGVNQGTTYSGKPQTREEQEWIANFIIEHGRLPADVEAAAWQTQQTGNQTYLPGSTMYELGYRSTEDLRQMNMSGGGYNAGPYSGSLLPEFGTIVLTDEQGRPIRRTRDLAEAQSYLQKGQYIANPEDFSIDLSNYPAGFKDTGLYKPMGNAPKDKYAIPSLNDYMQTLDPNELYKMRAQEYINSFVIRDAQKVADIEEQLLIAQEDNKRGLLSDTDWQKVYTALSQALDNLWTGTKAGKELEKVAIAIAQNRLFSERPYYAESLSLKPGALTEGWNKYIEEQTKLWADEQKSKSGMTSAGMVGGGIVNAPANAQMTQSKPQVRVTGTENTEYMDFTKSLGVSLNSQAWLLDNYSYLVNMWQAKGRDGQTLMDFVREYLANGGWNEFYSLPAAQRGENTKRFAPTVIYR